MDFKILVTGKNRKVATDICEHLEKDRGYTTIKCDPSKSALFETMTSDLPKVVIICMGGESEENIRVYDIMRSAILRGSITTIVVTDDEDEKMFMKYTGLERVYFISRPISLTALYEKLSDIETMMKEEKDGRLSAFREYINENAFRKNSVLVVDDDTEQLIVIKEQLEDFFDVTCVKSGFAAFNFLAKKKADVIILDYLMPEMDGPEVLRKIQFTSDWQDIPVIFLTGMSEKEKVLWTIAELRPQGYIIKPAKKSELVAKIIDVLEG